jgi:hypothetical protein
VLAGSIGTLSAIDPRLGLMVGGLFGAFGAVFLFFHPRLAFLFVVFYVPTQFWLTYELHVLPTMMTVADDAILILLALRVLGDRLRSGRSIERTPWDLPFLLYFGIGILSVIVNKVPLINAVTGLRAPVFYGLVLFVLVNGSEHFDIDYLGWIWKLLLVFCALQILTGIYQYPARGFGADSLTGTIGSSGANELGVVLLPFLFYLISKRLDAGERGVLPMLGIVSIAMTIILCGARGAWFSAIPVALVLWGGRLRRVKTIVSSAILVGLVYFVVARIVLMQSVDSVASAIGLKGIYGALFLVSSGGGNMAYYPIVWNLVHLYAPVPLLGLGPGMVSSEAAISLHAPLYQNVLYDYFGQTEFGLDGGVESQVLATAGEVGVIGFLAVLSMIVIWIVIALRTYRRSRDPEERALSAAVLAAAAAAVLLAPIKNVWETPHVPPFVLWLSGAILYVRLRARGGIPHRRTE